MNTKREKLNPPLTEEQIAYLQQLVGDIRYGTITLVFQDGKLVQVEKMKK